MKPGGSHLIIIHRSAASELRKATTSCAILRPSALAAAIQCTSSRSAGSTFAPNMPSGSVPDGCLTQTYGNGGKTHDPPIRYRTPPRYHAPRVLADIACAASEAIDRYLRSRPIGCAAHSEPRLMQGNVAQWERPGTLRGAPQRTRNRRKKISARRRRKIRDLFCRKKISTAPTGKAQRIPKNKLRRQNPEDVQRGSGVQGDSFAQ